MANLIQRTHWCAIDLKDMVIKESKLPSGTPMLDITVSEGDAQLTISLWPEAMAELVDRLGHYLQDRLIAESRAQCAEAMPPVDVIDVEQTLTAEQLREALKRE